MLYLLHGANAHHKRQVFTGLYEKYKEYTIHILEASDPGHLTKSIVDSVINGVSLFDSSQKLVCIKSFMEFEEKEYLQTIAKTISSSRDIVLVLETSEKIRTNAKILTFTPKENITYADMYSYSKLEEIADKKLQIAGIKEHVAIAHKVVALVDGDPFSVESETDKLILFISMHKDKRIDEFLLEDILSKSFRGTIWEYLKSISSGDTYKAINIVLTLLENGENEFGILSMITWNLRMLMVVASAKGISDFEIAKDFAYNPYSLKNIKDVIARFSLRKLTIVYEKIIDLEYKMKNGMIEPRLGLILLSFYF